MRQFANSSEQSLLDLVNETNDSSLDLSEVSLDSPISNATAEKNTQVTLNGKGVFGGQSLAVNYARQDAKVVFGETPSVAVVTDGKTTTEIVQSVLHKLAMSSGVPVNETTVVGNYADNKAVLDFTKHFVLSGTLSFNVSSIVLTDLSTLVATKSTLDHFKAGETFTQDTSLDCILDLIDSTNSIKLDRTAITVGKPSAFGGTSDQPSDLVTITAKGDSEAYKNNFSFQYNRLNIEDLITAPVELNAVSNLNAFYAQATAGVIAPILQEQLGIPISPDQLRVRNIATVDDGFTATVSILDNYVLRSAGGITVHSAKAN